MRRFTLPALAAAALLALPATGAHAASFSLEHALTMRTFQGLEWSADGTRLAFVVTQPDTAENTTQQDVWMWDARTNRARQLTRFAKNDYAPQFSAGGDTIAFLSARGTGDDVKPAIWFLPLDGGEPFAFGRYPESVGEIAWSPDGRTIAFTMLDTLDKQVREWRKKKWDHVVEDEQLQFNHLWVVDVATGKQKRLTSGSFHVSNPRWSPDSRSIAVLTSPTGRPDDGNATDLAIVNASNGMTRMLGVMTGNHVTWSPDGKYVAWAAMSDRTKYVAKSDLWVALASPPNPAVGAPRNLTASFDEDAYEPAFSTHSDTLFFHAAIRTSSVVAAVPVAGGTVTLGTDRRGEAMPMQSSGSRVAWVQSSSNAAAEVWVADHANLEGRPVTAIHAALSKLSLANTRVVSWTSTDGVTVEGVLVRPVTAWDHVPMKTLVLLHGGPYGTRYGLGFQPYAQYFAARGYQVFLPNFRSSGGYGTKFMLRERADWGGQDWRDVNSGLDSLVKWKLADPERLASMGHSYGGYLTAWAITQTHRFDAAIVSAGATDLPALWGQSDTHRYRAFEFGGEPWKTFDEWRASSPLAFIQNVKTPTLVLNGEADQRIPFPQAQVTYQSLKALGVPTEFVHYPREPHGLREPRHRADWLVRMGDWLDRWVK